MESTIVPERIPDNSVIAHYRVLSKIGAGGMGEVYKAQDETLERPVALKVLPPEVLESTDRVRRFVGEAKAASALNHPNIVTIHEIGQSAVTPPGDEPPPAQSERKIYYIAMEFIAGSTLKSHIHGGETELRKLVEIMAQAAQGLAKAHNAGIVHRDLKPDNIMVTEDGYAKIVDFGLAKLTEKRKEEQEGEDHTQEGMVMGTVAYMSPEQVQGKIVDQRSDIFSFGCILFECVTRKRPFQSDTAIDMMHRIVFGQAPPIGELNPDAPEELDRIVRKCLAKDPDERFQSIKEVAVDLKNLARDWAMQPSIGGFAVASSYRSDPRMPVVTSGQQPTYTRSATSPPPSASPAPSTLKRPPRHKPIGRWVFRGVLLLLVVLVAWLWYSHPDISGLGERAPATLPLVEDRRTENETGVQWEWIDYERIAAPLREAVVAAVDAGFMERTPPAIEDLRQEGAVGDLVREKKIPGLSPISRQAARAAVLGSSGPLDPIRQFVVAFDLEKSLPKERILELYLNSIEFTPEIYGVEAAAQHHFKRSASSLDAQQSALLAASIGTVEIDLGDPPAWLKARQEMILERMRGSENDE
jgi:serine/threonine protein kinase